ncbi:hypothetical protein G6F56_013433 [Rhizopus delemar]|nr:hypothetical protein G6F56_013433 [Rhizopus delemar]
MRRSENREYLVRWKNYSSEWDEWLKIDNFNDPSPSLAVDVVSPVFIGKKRSLPNSHNSVLPKPTRQSKRIRQTITKSSNDSRPAASSIRTRNRLPQSSL